VNLLGGRARTKYLHPFSWNELGDRYDFARATRHGLLPPIYLSDDPVADLQAYTGSYLQQEIVAEGATRNVPAFSRFLHVAAQANATVVNFTNVANDAQVPRTTVYEYFEILKDTLIVHELPAWKLSKKRKPLVSSKYYFFDVGVVGSLQGREFRPGTTEFGEAFETLIIHELVCFRDYEGGDALTFWRSDSGFEVDFIIGDHTAVEAKAKRNVGESDLRSLRALAEEKKLKRYVCVSLEARRRKVGNISVLPLTEFFEELWAGKYH
jgi:predicted AAA+ superfamily ATPase